MLLNLPRNNSRVYSDFVFRILILNIRCNLSRDSDICYTIPTVWCLKSILLSLRMSNLYSELGSHRTCSANQANITSVPSLLTGHALIVSILWILLAEFVIQCSCHYKIYFDNAWPFNIECYYPDWFTYANFSISKNSVNTHKQICIMVTFLKICWIKSF